VHTSFKIEQPVATFIEPKTVEVFMDSDKNLVRFERSTRTRWDIDIERARELHSKLGAMLADHDQARAPTSDVAKVIKWTARAEFTQVQYTDGTGTLGDVTLRDTEGVEIVGNGSLQAPLAVAVKPGYRIIRDN